MVEPLDDPIVPENPETRRDWEVIQEDADSMTARLRIVGGWLYRTVVYDLSKIHLDTSSGPPVGVALVFVPGRLTE